MEFAVISTPPSYSKKKRELKFLEVRLNGIDPLAKAMIAWLQKSETKLRRQFLNVQNGIHKY